MTETTSDVQALARKIAAERRAVAPQSVRFSRGLRRQIVSEVQISKQSRKALAETLGLSASVIQNWVAAELRTSKTIGLPSPSPKAVPGQLQRVSITQPATVTASGLQLVFPSGVRLVGLTLPQLRELLGAAR